MTNRKSSPAFRAAGLLLAGAVSAAALALAAPASAEQQRHTETITKKVVIGGHDSERHAAKCEGERVEVAADKSSNGKKEAVKLVFCGEKGEGPKALADSLAKALSRIESDSDMDSALKSEVRSKLEAKIAELRARG